MSLLRLSDRPELIDATARLLAQQWPQQSASSRRTALATHCRRATDGLPCHLLLVDGSEAANVVAHCRLDPACENADGISAALTSLVVQHERRGTGLGRKLLCHAEVVAAAAGYGYLYLWTHDAQGFYAACGYTECARVALQRPALKSLGAAKKKHADVRLDGVLEYGERLPSDERGYYFMNSPGNDLESIAGQVASGCNAIYFVTGNGSITNFPFVPTIKIVTTTPRFELLAADMDVNAGAYQDGAPMDELGAELFDLTLAVAGGQRSKGEQAGHAQVQVWRNWPQTDESSLPALRAAPVLAGEPLAVAPEQPPQAHFEALRSERGIASDQVGLVLPTSLCSGQIAQLIAARLNTEGLGRDKGLSRFVALVHTEGCGVAGAEAEGIYARAMLGYLTHPLVRCAVLLEHGCEKTHNDYMRNQLAERGVDTDYFGWASVQLDGGIDKVGAKVADWFRDKLDTLQPAVGESAGLGALRVGLVASGPLGDDAGQALARLTRWLVGAGSTVVVPKHGALLASAAYADALFAGDKPAATLAHGQAVAAPGYYVLETPTDHWTEIATGLGATGVEVMLAHAGEHPLQGHPLVPLVQVATSESVRDRYAEDLDLALAGASDGWAEALLELLLAVASRRQQPLAAAQRNIDFQFTRGLLGVSM